MSKGKRSIFILYVSVGSGHKIVADAILEAVEDKSKEIKVEILDVLAFSKIKLSSSVSSIDKRSKLAGTLYNILWRNYGVATLAQSASSLILTNFSSLEDLIIKENPSALICTHGLASLLVSGIKRKHNLTTPQIAVLTDMRAHPYWSTSEVDLYCASTLPAKLDLLNSGIDDRKIIVTGIPLRRHFSKKYKSNSNKDTGILKALLLSGAIQSEMYAGISDKIPSILPMLGGIKNVFLTIVCGNNKALKTSLERQSKKLNLEKIIKTEGYVNNMAQLISQHNIVVTKPGGLISSETLAMGKPMLLLGETYGQERANAEFLINNSVAIRLQSLDNLPKNLGVVAKQKWMLRDMARRARRIYMKESASKVVTEILKLIEKGK